MHTSKWLYTLYLTFFKNSSHLFFFKIFLFSVKVCVYWCLFNATQLSWGLMANYHAVYWLGSKLCLRILELYLKLAAVHLTFHCGDGKMQCIITVFHMSTFLLQLPWQNFLKSATWEKVYRELEIPASWERNLHREHGAPEPYVILYVSLNVVFSNQTFNYWGCSSRLGGT